MTNEQIKKILDAHFVPYYTAGGNIYADSMIGGTALFEQVENVSRWSQYQLLSWLGY